LGPLTVLLVVLVVGLIVVIFLIAFALVLLVAAPALVAAVALSQIASACAISSLVGKCAVAAKKLAFRAPTLVPMTTRGRCPRFSSTGSSTDSAPAS
jgi:hypothetical protein